MSMMQLKVKKPVTSTKNKLGFEKNPSCCFLFKTKIDYCNKQWY
jgi:hypothetical protein